MSTRQKLSLMGEDIQRDCKTKKAHQMAGQCETQQGMSDFRATVQIRKALKLCDLRVCRYARRDGEF